jgi:putative flippase GtrA
MAMMVRPKGTLMKGLLFSLLRFASAGGASFVINLGGTAFMHELLGVPEEVAFAVALAIAFLVNFLVCRYYVFEGRSGDARRQLVEYLLASLCFRGIEYVGFLLLHTIVGIPYVVAIFIVLLCSFFFKFAFYGKVVFRSGEKDVLTKKL